MFSFKARNWYVCSPPTQGLRKENLELNYIALSAVCQIKSVIKVSRAL